MSDLSDSSFSDSDSIFTIAEDVLSLINNDCSLQDDKHLKMFDGLDKFEEEKMKVLKETGNKSNKQKLMKAFTPTPGMKDKWMASIEGTLLLFYFNLSAGNPKKCYFIHERAQPGESCYLVILNECLISRS